MAKAVATAEGLEPQSRQIEKTSGRVVFHQKPSSPTRRPRRRPRRGVLRRRVALGPRRRVHPPRKRKGTTFEFCEFILLVS